MPPQTTVVTLFNDNMRQSGLPKLLYISIESIDFISNAHERYGAYNRTLHEELKGDLKAISEHTA